MPSGGQPMPPGRAASPTAGVNISDEPSNSIDKRFEACLAELLAEITGDCATSCRHDIGNEAVASCPLPALSPVQNPDRRSDNGSVTKNG